MMIEWRRMPLFYAALCLAAALLAVNFFFPQFSNFLPRDHIYWKALKNRPDIFIGGSIVSEVEERETFFHERKQNFILKAKRIWDAENGGSFTTQGRVKVYLNDAGTPLSYGDELVMKGELKRPEGLRNEGGFNSRTYLEQSGIRAVFFADRKAPLKVLSHHNGWLIQEKAIAVKKFLSKKLSEGFDKRDASFLKALFLGEKSGLEEDFKDLFIKTGTMHILAVSGFNIGFLSLSIFFLLKPFPLSRNFKLIVTLVAIWVYCFVVGWQAPVVRASLMAMLFIIGELLGRKTKVLNTLGFAALVILLIQPKQLFDVGFQLSFLAVFALAAFLPLFVKRPELLPNEKWTFKEKVFQYTNELFWVSFVCILVTLPVTVQNFYIVTPMALLANLVVVPLSFLLFFSGLCFFLTFWWLPKFLSVIPFAIQMMMKVFVGSLFALENLPGAYFIVGKLAPLLFCLLVSGIAYFLWEKRIKNSYARALVLSLFFLNIFLSQGLFKHLHRPFQMTVLDVGQGDSIYVEFPHGGNLLMDAGKGGDGDKGRWAIAPFLKSKGVTSIDALVISHPQEDHIGGMPTVLDEFKVKNVIEAGSSYQSKLFQLLKAKIQKENARDLIVKRGNRIEGFKGVEVYVLHPAQRESQSKNINNDSVVLKIVYGQTSFLLTGDIEKEAMADILNEVGHALSCTVLKVPHHGAKMNEVGEAFVKTVDPRISVISVGDRNPFHHPSGRTLNILEAVTGNRVLRTDQYHELRLISDGEGVYVYPGPS